MRLGAPSFDKGIVSVAVLSTYLLIFFLVFWADVLPDVPTPEEQGGLNLHDAYLSLHRIAERPHPYNSHANEYVREYILSEVQDVARRYPHVHVVDDLRSNGSWASPTYGVYFEGTNILVKIDGTDRKYREKGGVLFSAHYDSVSTAPGATDDGAGVASLLQLVEYFAENRVQRTAIFNINNGEEDWLNGAHAFLQHPWSRIPDSFLNLEGASSGGRPLLFRATSSAVLGAFKTRNVPRPHANVISAEAFNRGVIKSGTDYSVYTEGSGMQGLDFAFYKGRSKYHTKYDAIPFTDGREKALWSMMEGAKGAGTALLNNSATHDPDRYVPAVYFDLFASGLVLFPLNTLYIFNILFLVLGPIVLSGLLFIQAVINAAHKHPSENRHDHHRPTLLTRIFTDFHLMWRWAKFWVALVVTAGVQAFLVFVFIKANPYVIYSSPYVVLFCFSSISFLTFTSIITSDLPLSRHSDPAESLPEAQKETVLLQCYALSWILLLLSTIAIGRSQVGALYFISFWSVGLWVACGLSSIETIFSYQDTPLKHSSRSRSSSRSQRQQGYDVEPTERTPLAEEYYNQEHAPAMYTETSPSRERRQQSEKDAEVINWWLLQFILVVPVPLVLSAHIANIVLDATCQTLADGSPKIFVYGLASFIGFLFVLPLAPFTFRIHQSVCFLILVLFVLLEFWALLWTFPFDSQTPLKVFFQQKVQLEGAVVVTSANTTSYTSPATVENIVTSLYGVPEYLKNDIVPSLPSAQDKEISCSKSKERLGVVGCSWSSGSSMLPSPGTASCTTLSTDDLKAKNKFFQASFIRTSQTSAQVTITGTNTKNCKLYFHNTPITKYTVQNASVGMQPHYGMPSAGITELRLWSRTYNKQFTVDVEWSDPFNLNQGLSGRVACAYAEYASASAGLPGQGENPAKGGFTTAKIPALEEALSFLPTWVVLSKFADGLVEVWEPFEV